MKESNIQQLIRIEAGNHNTTIFRVNVGTGVTGNGQIRHKDGSVTVKNARPFSTGVPRGYSDLSGVKSVTVTSDMVGEKIGIAVFAEVKTDTGRIRDEQENFLTRMKGKGAIAGIVRSVEDFVELIS